MISHLTALEILSTTREISPELLEKVEFVGFVHPERAIECLRDSVETLSQQAALAEVLPGLLYALSETPDSDRSVLNFQRYLKSVESRDAVLQMMVSQPRAVEILIRLFVGSQFLTEILLRHPEALQQLTQHKRLSEFKSREEFIEEADRQIGQPTGFASLKSSLRKYHQREILRIAACDTFRIMDLKTVTLQLSLLADAIVHVALRNVCRLSQQELDDFAVIAFGKLGGLELNYSSDIDLVFISGGTSDRYAAIGQNLIAVLSDFTSDGFLYRVDMRLRPWGKSGPLVTSYDTYVNYFDHQAELWERQALLKARTIAGNYHLGDELLERLRHDAFQVDAEEIRQNIVSMKRKIEQKIRRAGHPAYAVKGGPGGIRDIEFLVQFLQLSHSTAFPQIRRVGTLESLIALSDANVIHAQEFRVLSTGYVILRTIEHSLQLMHNQPESFLPQSKRELAYLARRLDFPDSEHFLEQYKKQTRAIRSIYQQHLLEPLGVKQEEQEIDETKPAQERFSPPINEGQTIDSLIRQLNRETAVATKVTEVEQNRFEVMIVGVDYVGDLPLICGMLFVYGFDILSGTAEILQNRHLIEDHDSGELILHTSHVPSSITTEQTDHAIEGPAGKKRIFFNRFVVRPTHQMSAEEVRSQSKSFSQELNDLFHISLTGETFDAQKKMLGRISEVVRSIPDPTQPLLPIEISVELDPASRMTLIHIQGEDVPGFLFELTNAITLSGLSIESMVVSAEGTLASDTLHVIDPKQPEGLNEKQLSRLRATIALVKHFTHLLPHAPNPEAAIMHFSELLENFFQRENWADQLETLQQPEVLKAIAQLLGFSDFLWEDFLRLQHENLFPVVTDIAGLQQPRTRQDLTSELKELIKGQSSADAVRVLNEFKDRAMMRVDMRHILGLQSAFGTFSNELTAVAETVVCAAVDLAVAEVKKKHGLPRTKSGEVSRYCVVALGKCGGRELGYASDIELMFLFDEAGQTDGQQRLPNVDFYQKVVEQFRNTVYAREKRIFAIDLRLRPYGNAGSLAVSKSSFTGYFHSDGPAWPYERQALVKLRPICGDIEFSNQILQLRDDLIYTGQQFDLTSMRAMREKQIRQFVEPGTFHAKLSPGGLVDCEYFVQALQITFGHLSPDVRDPNTRAAMKGLEAIGVLSHDQRVRLRDAYRFLRRLIDGMRMVRGDATDLTIPHHHSEQFEFLAKRLGIEHKVLHTEIERQTCAVIELIVSFEDLIQGNNLKLV